MKAKKEEYDEKNNRLKQEAETKKQEKITKRIQSLAQYGLTYDTLEHGIMDDTSFSELIEGKKIAFEEIEKARLLTIESDRIAREKFEEDQRIFREEQEEITRKNKEVQDRIDAERKAIDEEKRAIEQSNIDRENATIREQELIKVQEEARLQ